MTPADGECGQAASGETVPPTPDTPAPTLVMMDTHWHCWETQVALRGPFPPLLTDEPGGGYQLEKYPKTFMFYVIQLIFFP